MRWFNIIDSGYAQGAGSLEAISPAATTSPIGLTRSQAISTIAQDIAGRP
jgi:hypothetical protein